MRDDMRNNDRYVRTREGRRRARFGNGWILIAILILIALFLFQIGEVKSQLENIQTLLKRIEVLEYGRSQSFDTNRTWGEEDYVARVGIVNVERPAQRTWKETLSRLEELGKDDPDIAAIARSSSQYPQEMLTALANNPEMADFVAGWLGRGIALENQPGGIGRGEGAVSGGLTDSEKEQTCPLFLQWDPRWGYESYGTSCIGMAGCGPTCLSMVLYGLTRDESLTPDRIAAWSMENGYYVEGTGTAWALMQDFPAIYGVKVAEPAMTKRAMEAELDEGHILICAMREGDFTLSGHFVVLYGYDESGFWVNDPNCVARSRKTWAFETLEKQIKKIWSYGKAKSV